MSATERLRRELDERDINWRTDMYYRDTNTCWRVGDFEWRASEERDGKLLIGCTHTKYLTPEQVIAATLGRVMLTADDVRDLIERHSDASGGNGRDFHNGAYVVIADELNATLGDSVATGERQDVADLEAENAKLREFLYDIIVDTEELAKAMREIGIEVDE